MNLSVRPLTLEDLPAVVEIEAVSYSHPWSLTAFQAELEQPDVCYFFGLFFASTLIGYYGFHLLFETLDVTKVTISPACRGNKLGTLLLEDLIARAKVINAERIILEVSVNNTVAINLYRRVGFSPVRTRPAYYQDGSDALMMELKL